MQFTQQKREYIRRLPQLRNMAVLCEAVVKELEVQESVEPGFSSKRIAKLQKYAEQTPESIEEQQRLLSAWVCNDVIPETAKWLADMMREQGASISLVDSQIESLEELDKLAAKQIYSREGCR